MKTAQQRHIHNQSTTTVGRAVGGLILSAFFLYGGGSYLLASTVDGATPLPENADSVGQLVAGAGLMLLNSAAVVTIGVLTFPVLRRQYRRTASSYLLTRVVEGILLAAPAVGILTLALTNPTGATTGDSESGLAGLARTFVENGTTTYWVAMAVLGIGSVAFCRALMRSGLLPRLLALGGMVAYSVFALGSLLELGGYPVGLMLSAPGGLFEVVAGSYLLFKGFRQVAPARHESVERISNEAMLRP